MSQRLIQDSTLSAIANAIRLKNGSKVSYLPTQMPSAIKAIETGGSNNLAKNIIEKTITGLNMSDVTTIGAYAFQSCSRLTSANFPECTSIGSFAFFLCPSLASLSFPKCTTIYGYAFHRCSSLKSVNFPKCTNISTGAFSSCASLTSVNFPECTAIGSYAFTLCPSLKSVNFPKCTTIYNSAFNSCISLTSVNFPKCATIYTYAFYRCYNLTSLTLGASSVCILRHSDAFDLTPIGGYSTSAGQYGSIYVPASLLASYQAATNWSYFSERFVGYE